MIATVNGVHVEGTPTEIAELMRAMKAPEGGDVAMLTPKQREVYDALARHPKGAHYVALAAEMGVPSDVVNSRLNALVGTYEGTIVKRLCSGTFAVVL
jgi:hypothetical protein